MQMIGSVILIAIIAFIIISIVLFIRDGKSSKKTGRARNMTCTVMFIISMVIAGLAVMTGILVVILAALVMRSM